jgi:hypothetical protein
MNAHRSLVLGSAPALAAAVAALPAFAHGPHGARGSGVVGLDAAARGRVVDVLVAEKRAEGVTLRHVRSRDGGRTWAEPRAVAAAGQVAGARRGNDPQIASVGERLIAVWSAPGTSRWGGAPVARRHGAGPFRRALDGGPRRRASVVALRDAVKR